MRNATETALRIDTTKDAHLASPLQTPDKEVGKNRNLRRRPSETDVVNFARLRLFYEDETNLLGEEFAKKVV